MKRNTLNVAALAGLLAGVSCATPALAQEPTDAASAPAMLDENALAALDRMGTALRALKHFTVTSDASLDLVLETGQKVELDAKVTYKVQQPNRMFVELVGDRMHRQLFYDRGKLTVYSPRLNYYATAQNEGKTLGELAVSAAVNYGVEFPLTDLFFWGTSLVPRSLVQSAMFVGPGTVGNEKVDHFALRQEGVDWEIWLSPTSSLPRKIVITDLSDPERPQYRARLYWDTTTPVDAGVFAFQPPAGSTRIELVPPQAVASASETEN
jgi:hypothetical protein